MKRSHAIVVIVVAVGLTVAAIIGLPYGKSAPAVAAPYGAPLPDVGGGFGDTLSPGTTGSTVDDVTYTLGPAEDHTLSIASGTDFLTITAEDVVSDFDTSGIFDHDPPAGNTDLLSEVVTPDFIVQTYYLYTVGGDTRVFQVNIIQGDPGFITKTFFLVVAPDSNVSWTTN